MQTVDVEKIKKLVATIQERAARIKTLCDPDDLTPFNQAIKDILGCASMIEQQCEKILE
jgi:hypothetical protein